MPKNKAYAATSTGDIFVSNDDGLSWMNVSESFSDTLLKAKPQDMLHEGLSASRLFADWLKGDLKTDFLEPEQQEAARAINRHKAFRVLSTDFIERFDAEPEK